MKNLGRQGGKINLTTAYIGELDKYQSACAEKIESQLKNLLTGDGKSFTFDYDGDNVKVYMEKDNLFISSSKYGEKINIEFENKAIFAVALDIVLECFELKFMDEVNEAMGS